MKKLNKQTEDLVEQYYKVTQDLKAAEKVQKALKERIYLALGKTTDAMSDRFLVEVKSITQQRLDAKALEAAEPEIYRTYLKESSYNKLNIKERAGI